MAEWIYFIHPPREDFAATMTADERAVWDTHFERLHGLLAEGVMILVGPTLGSINTGIAILKRPTRTTPVASWRRTRRSAAASPTASSGPSAWRCSAVVTTSAGLAVACDA